jgi:hypothetical protein
MQRRPFFIIFEGVLSRRIHFGEFLLSLIVFFYESVFSCSLIHERKGSITCVNKYLGDNKILVAWWCFKYMINMLVFSLSVFLFHFFNIFKDLFWEP